MLLAPYRVLDLTDDRGNLAGSMLAAVGAEVILVEPPEGMRSRHLAPFAHDEVGPETSLWFQAWNRGKRSVVLDLEGSEADRDRFRELVRTADVLLDSQDVGWTTRLGLGPAELAAINPALVYVSISAYGTDGPKAEWPATDLTAWASAGPMSITGDRDRQPVPVGVPQAFLHASGEAAGAAVVALLERARSGLGQHVDCSAQEASTPATQAAILSAANGGSPHERFGGGSKAGPLSIQMVWPCKDGHLSITFLFGSSLGAFTRRFMEWIHEEGFCDEATLNKDWIGYGALLVSGQEPISEYDRIREVVRTFTITKTKQEMLDEAMKRKLLIAPVLTTEEIVEMEQLSSRGYWHTVDGVIHPGAFGKPSATPLPVCGAAPRLGAHTDEVLADLSRRPAVEVAEPIHTTARALEGLKVLDLSWVVAGPTGSRVLADHGATVVRVESSKRIETARTVAPYKNDVAEAESSVLFSNLNAGKIGLGLDLTNPEAREVVLDMVRWADVVLESFAPKVLKGWGLDADTIRSVNPNVVMLSSCLFGQTGPLAGLAGLGTMAAALTGFFGVTGWPDRSPCGPYGAYTDYISPRFANTVLLAALDHKRRTGESQYIDYAQAEGALHALAPAILEYTVNGRIWGPSGDGDRNRHPHGVFRCDGGEERWVAIACETDAQRAALAAITGGLEREQIEGWTSQRLPDEAMHTLVAAGVAAHTVQNSIEAVADPQLLARNHFVTFPHPVMGEVTIERPRAQFSRTPPMATAAGPCIGQHTYEVLTEILGYDDERFTELLVSGALE